MMEQIIQVKNVAILLQARCLPGDVKIRKMLDQMNQAMDEIRDEYQSMESKLQTLEKKLEGREKEIGC